MLDYFTSLDFVVQRTSRIKRAQVVAVACNPETEEVEAFSQTDFEFCGFDVMDSHLTTSALLGNSRFPGVFEVSELSDGSGLIPSRNRAFGIRDMLRRQFPDQQQAQCNVWGIWLYTGTT